MYLSIVRENMNVFVVDTCMKALVSHGIISNKFLYKVSIIYCFPLRIKMANFFRDIIAENLWDVPNNCG